MESETLPGPLEVTLAVLAIMKGATLEDENPLPIPKVIAAPGMLGELNYDTCGAGTCFKKVF